MSEVPAWRYVGASVTGTSHEASAAPCQDAHRADVLTDGSGRAVLVAVVADGAGSACFAAEGAALACATLHEEAASWARSNIDLTFLDGDRAGAWLGRVREVIEDQAQRAGSSVREFACTLLAVLVGESETVCLQVGDGAIVLGDGATYAPAFWPDSGEYANVTYFVTDDDAATHVRFVRVDRRVEDVAVFSDGLQGLALSYATQAAFAPFFEPLFRRLSQEPAGPCEGLARELEAFLGSERVNERTDDDKTLVLATRRRAPSESSATPDDGTASSPPVVR